MLTLKELKLAVLNFSWKGAEELEPDERKRIWRARDAETVRGITAAAPGVWAEIVRRASRSVS